MQCQSRGDGEMRAELRREHLHRVAGLHDAEGRAEVQQVPDLERVAEHLAGIAVMGLERFGVGGEALAGEQSGLQAVHRRQAAISPFRHRSDIRVHGATACDAMPRACAICSAVRPRM